MVPALEAFDPAPDSESLAKAAGIVRELLLCCEEISSDGPRRFASAQLTRFKLWASNIGVFAARHISLDYRLRTAPTVRITIEGNLEEISRHLLYTLKATTEISDEDIDVFSNLSQSQIFDFGLELLRNSNPSDELRIDELRAVEETITILHNLSLAIRKASNRNILAKSPKLLDCDNEFTIVRETGDGSDFAETVVEAVRFEVTSTFEDFVRKVLANKWLRPSHEAELEPEHIAYRQVLLDRCVQVISARRKQLTYFGRHQSKLARKRSIKMMPIVQRRASVGTSQPSKLGSISGDIPSARAPDPVREPLYEPSNIAPSDTVVSEFVPAKFVVVPPSTAHSSAPSSAPSSTASSSGGFGTGLFEAPPPPKMETDEKEKACPYCCIVFPAKIFSKHKKSKRWKSHLLEDLQPYICLFANCSQWGKTFSSFHDWQTHLHQPHSSGWLCPLDADGSHQEEGTQSYFFNTLSGFNSHLNTYHADLDSSATEDLIQMASQPATITTWCFVCFEAFPTPISCLNHVASHLRSMALLALPWRDDIEDNELVSSDRLISTESASDQGEPDLVGVDIWESTDNDEIAPKPAKTLSPREFASLLSVIYANSASVESRVQDAISDGAYHTLINPSPDEAMDDDGGNRMSSLSSETQEDRVESAMLARRAVPELQRPIFSGRKHDNRTDNRPTLSTSPPGKKSTVDSVNSGIMLTREVEVKYEDDDKEGRNSLSPTPASQEAPLPSPGPEMSERRRKSTGVFTPLRSIIRRLRGTSVDEDAGPSALASRPQISSPIATESSAIISIDDVKHVDAEPAGVEPAGAEPADAGGYPGDIYKSLRVSMDDPCYKVLPAALKKYQINPPWDHYALYIVYGGEEHVIGLHEKPLMILRELDRQGKNPMFMLRKVANLATQSLPQDPSLEVVDIENNLADIFQSLRVSLDDTCDQVVPKALEVYNIRASPDTYYIVLLVEGEHDRRLEPMEKPLVIYRSLQSQGKNPKFKLRRKLDSHMHQDMHGVATTNKADIRPFYNPPGGVI